MIDSPSAILKKFFIDQLVFGDPTAGTLVWPIYDSFLPDEPLVPDSAAAITDTDGLKDGRIMKTGESIMHQGLQLLVRSQDKTDAWTQIDKAKSYLDAIQMTSVSVGLQTYTVWSVTLLAPPMFIGIEPGTKRRRLYSLNMRTTIVAVGVSIPFQPPVLPQGQALETIVTKTSNYAVQPSDSSFVFTNTGASSMVAFQLPPWQLGLFYSFINDSVNGIKVLASGTDVVRVGGQVSVGGGNAQNTDKGSAIAFAALSTGEWVAQFGHSGGWNVT